MQIREIDVQKLLEMAEEKSSHSRTELFSNISALLIDNSEGGNDRERALMVEILNRLLHDVEMQVRQELSTRLAESKAAPYELLKILSNDEIDVARPILLQSDLLRDDDLLQIIKHRTQEHQMAIAMRQNVSEVVSSALVETGHEDVVKTLLENVNAKISHATLEYLVEQSQRVDSYQNPLLSRSELKPELAKKMYAWVSETLQQKIVREYKIDRTELDKAVKASVDSLISQEDQEYSEKTVELVEAIVKSQELTPGLLAKTLRDGEIPLFVGLFSKMTELDIATARKIVFDGEGEVFALACKAVGFETHQFSDLYKLIRITRSSSRDVRITEMSHLLSYFEQMKKITAQNILRSWQRDPGYLDAINKSAHGKRLNSPGAA